MSSSTTPAVDNPNDSYPSSNATTSTGSGSTTPRSTRSQSQNQSPSVRGGLGAGAETAVESAAAAAAAAAPVLTPLPPAATSHPSTFSCSDRPEKPDRLSVYIPPTPPITPPKYYSSPTGSSSSLPSPVPASSSSSATLSNSSLSVAGQTVSGPITPDTTPPLTPAPASSSSLPQPPPPTRPHKVTRGLSSPDIHTSSFLRPGLVSRSNSHSENTGTMTSRRSNLPPQLQTSNQTPRSPSALLPRIVEPNDPSSWPRRRVSLSVQGSPSTPHPQNLLPHPYPQPHPVSHPHPHPHPHAHSRHHPHPRRRARTMSFPVRTSRQVTPRRPIYRSRRAILTVLILLSLFLVGTVIVLSSVSYYLAIPAWSYLTEEEVPWGGSDAIRPLRYSPPGTAKQQKREPDAEDEMVLRPPPIGQADFDANAEGGEWDVDGVGSGGYWMRKEWDGHVQDSSDWRRLYNTTARPGERMPRLIHQTWKDDYLPVKWRKAWKECREGMPDYDYFLWTDEISRDFIKANYPAHLHMYDSYKYPIQRADSIRYFVLHHFGGIYMDLDIGCRRRLDPLLSGDWDAVLPITKPVGISNDLILSSKGSNFIDDTIHALPAWNHEWVSNYPTVMFSTGPMFLSAQFAIHTSAHPITSTHPRSEVRVLPTSLYGKNVLAETVPHSFFAHFYGSSWHSDDAGFITFLGQWGKKLMWVGSIVVIAGTLRLVYLKATGIVNPRYQLLSVLPTSSSKSHVGPTGGRDPDAATGSGSASFGTGIEAIHSQQLPHDIASTLKRAGNLILAAPATLLIGDRRSRRRTGLLYFVPALFQPGPVAARPRRTASEASQLPLRRSKKDRERERDRDVSRLNLDSLPPPPPYQRVEGDGGSVPLIHDEPQSMDLSTEDDSTDAATPTLPKGMLPPRQNSRGSTRDRSYAPFLRDIESGSSDATENEDADGDADADGEDSGEAGQRGWTHWPSSSRR